MGRGRFLLRIHGDKGKGELYDEKGVLEVMRKRQLIDILIFALITLFFGYRIYVALGRTSDDEGEGGVTPRVKNRKEEGFVTVGERVRGENVRRRSPLRDGDTEGVCVGKEEEWEGLVREVDDSFDILRFKVGVRKAFVMILESFARGEKGVLRGLTSESVYRAFEVDIEAREESGAEREVTILEVEGVEVEDVRIEGEAVSLLVMIRSRQVIVERDSEGEIVEGDEDNELELCDRWVFTKDVKSESMVWLLEETEVEKLVGEN